MKTALLSLILALADAPAFPPQPVAPPAAVWQPQHTPPACQRMHAEVNKCEVGRRSCNQYRVNYWRKRCERK